MADTEVRHCFECPFMCLDGLDGWCAYCNAPDNKVPFPLTQGRPKACPLNSGPITIRAAEEP